MSCSRACVSPRVLHLPGEAGLVTKKPLPKAVVAFGKLGHCFTAVYTSSVFQLCCKGYKLCQNTGQLSDKGSGACTGVLQQLSRPQSAPQHSWRRRTLLCYSPMEKSLLASFHPLPSCDWCVQPSAVSLGIAVWTSFSGMTPNNSMAWPRFPSPS